MKVVFTVLLTGLMAVLWGCGASSPPAQTAEDVPPAQESEAVAQAPEEAVPEVPADPRLASVTDGDSLDVAFLQNKWKVGAVEVDGKRIEGDALNGSEHYFTMKMGEYGNFYQSNIEYDTCGFNTHEYGKVLEVVTSKGKDVSKKQWAVKRLTKDSLVLQDPDTSATYYMVFDPDADDSF